MRRSVALVCLVVLLIAPFSASARALTQIVDTSQATVTRANFFTWSFEVLQIAKAHPGCDLPYQRIPRGLRATMCAAQERGALAVFGTSKNLQLNKAILRGEALEVLTALTGYQETADVSGFSDLKTDSEKRAVQNAVALKWMVPERATFFGVKKAISGTETLSLLQAVSGQSVVPTITINVGSRELSTNRLPKQELMETIWDILKRDFINSEKISDDEAAYRAIEGLVDSLNDPYTTFFRPEGASDFQAQFKDGELNGIGAHVEDKDDKIIIVAPLPGSPAERAGLLPGDQITDVDGTSVEGMSLDKAVKLIRGPKGTFVELIILRSGSKITVRIQRDTISIPEVQVSWQGDVAVVQLLQFGETTETKIRDTFAEINKKHPRGIILDLRNNPGGLLNAADVVVSNFVADSSVVAQVKRRNETTSERTQGAPTVDASVKVVVLVNKGSASASEIVAGALQDHKRATIVGVQTFGKGSVQEVIALRSGEAVKVTVAHYLTPNGHEVDGIGITPDVVVEGEPRTQLDRALGLLR